MAALKYFFADLIYFLKILVKTHLSPDLRDAGGEELAEGAGELHHGAEGGVAAAGDGPGPGLQRRAVRGVDRREASCSIVRVRDEPDNRVWI